MRILVAASDGLDIHFVAADFLGEGGEVGGRGHDLQFAGRARGGGAEQGENEGGRKGDGSRERRGGQTGLYRLHDDLQKSFLERVSAMRAHHEKKLKQEFVGVRKIAWISERAMP